MRDFLIAGNWKMNGSTAANAELTYGILAGMPLSDSVKLLVCPPFPYLSALSQKLEGSKLALGAQNVSQHEAGAFTGEVSAAMLKDVACEYVIVGHSERRAMMLTGCTLILIFPVVRMGLMAMPCMTANALMVHQQAIRPTAAFATFLPGSAASRRAITSVGTKDHFGS